MQVGNSSNALGRLSFGRIEELKRQRPFLRYIGVIVIMIMMIIIIMKIIKRRPFLRYIGIVNMIVINIIITSL